MTVTPLAQYRDPGYPTSAILLAHPELLRTVPTRWQSSAILVSVLATAISLAAPARAQQDAAQPPVQERLIDTDNEPMLKGDVMMPVAPVPQGMVNLQPPVTPSAPNFHPLMHNGRMRERALRDGDIITVPLRVVAEYLGAKVEYHFANDTISIVRGTTHLTLTRSCKAQLNGAAVELPAPVRSHLQSYTLYAPARFLAETLGARVAWLAKTNMLEIIPEHGEAIRFEVIDPNSPLPPPPPCESSAAPSLEQRRADLRDFLGWLKAQELI